MERCVVRSEERLRRGRQEVAELRQALAIINVRPTSEESAIAPLPDMRASIATAEAPCLGALERCESGGSHNRPDYPDQTRR